MFKKNLTFILSIIIVSLFFGAIFLIDKNSKDKNEQKNEEVKILDQNQNNNNNNEQNNMAIKTETTQDGLKIEILKEGEGDVAKVGNQVAVHYVGVLESGQKFDSSLDRKEPFVFNLGVGQVIKGWDQGVVGMKKGEIRRLTVPSQLGYGEQGAGGVIPPNATLIFEIQLLDIK